MKLFFLSIFLSFALLHAEVPFDSAVDQQVIECLQSSKYSHTLFKYPFKGEDYPILVIHNPEKLALWADCFSSSPNFLSLTMVAYLPLELSSHLQQILSDVGIDELDSIIDLHCNYYMGFDVVHAIQCAEKIDDPVFDAQIKELFHSTQFVNKVFYYHLGEDYYKVRIIHNPEKKTFYGTHSFSLDCDPNFHYTVCFNQKYGILTDKKVPQEFMDHLISLADASYWDWYFNFKTSNGVVIEYSRIDCGWATDTETIYTLKSWYYFADDLYELEKSGS